MNKISYLFFAGSLATTLFLGQGLAKAQDAPADNQGGAPPAMSGDHDGMDKKDGKGRLEEMKQKLGLTDDQAAKLKTAMKKQMEANKPLRDQEKIDIDTLQQKVDSKASDSDITAALDKLKEDRKALQEAQERSMEKMKSILTPTQQAKWVLSMGRGMGMGKWDRKKKGEWKKDSKDGGDDAAKPAPEAAPAN
ncbi:MAG TPA: Spy/CpxP family protein refolding chaperone [bacterium]|jgi:Spy/CpxP family protein refolding chaperone|nr:Spy/CpxP family protein refolding chaperone [bacterium]